MNSRFNRRPMVVAASLITIFSTSAIIAAPQAEDGFARRFEQVWKAVGQMFYDPAMNGVDWTAVGEKYRQEAAAAPNPTAFKNVVNRMLAELHASHLGYFTEDDFEFYLLRSLFASGEPPRKMDHIGITGSVENGAFAVKAILDGSPAAQAGIRFEDRLTDERGAPISTAGTFRGHAGEGMTL